jgi:hypothetical protein
MKASEILWETPYLHHGEMSRKMLDGSISVGAYLREYRKIGTVNDIQILMDVQDTHLVGLKLDKDLSSMDIKHRIIPVFKLIFKVNNMLNFKHDFVNVIQVDRVAISRSSGNEGIMSSVYKMLVDSGYTIVSDITQFDPARGLWKKLATDTEYKVYVADIEHGIFKDADGQYVVYDGENIPDSDIWSEGSNFDGQYRVLILTE